MIIPSFFAPKPPKGGLNILKVRTFEQTNEESRSISVAAAGLVIWAATHSNIPVITANM